MPEIPTNTRLFGLVLLNASLLLAAPVRAGDDLADPSQSCDTLCGLWRGLGSFNRPFTPQDFGASGEETSVSAEAAGSPPRRRLAASKRPATHKIEAKVAVGAAEGPLPTAATVRVEAVPLPPPHHPGPLHRDASPVVTAEAARPSLPAHASQWPAALPGGAVIIPGHFVPMGTMVLRVVRPRDKPAAVPDVSVRVVGNPML
jgi:hypothetical protein